MGGNLEVEPPEPHHLRNVGDQKALRDALRAHRLGGGGDENRDALFEEGSAITLTKRDEVSYPKTCRIGFVHDSEERVKEITRPEGRRVRREAAEKVPRVSDVLVPSAGRVHE